MKIYTHYSDSHKSVYDNFKHTLRNIYSVEQAAIRVLYHPQTTKSGAFMTQGWLDSMEYKLNLIIDAINENKGSWFVFADCDIQFFNPFLNDLENNLQNADIVCQEDRGSLCAGFFACQGNLKAANLFEAIKKNFRRLVNDQVALNNLKHLATCKMLNNKKYYTIGNFFNNNDGTYNWDNNTNIMPPREMLVHHANYVVGVENKQKLLKMIKHNYENLVR
jgi:hypothetical protein